MSQAIGIDFGTVYSRVAVLDAKGGCRVLPDSQDSQRRILFPSVVAFPENKPMALGWEAVNLRSGHPGRAISSIKKWLARTPEKQILESGYLPQAWKSIDGKTIHAKMDAKKFTPEELAAFLLKSLKLRAEQSLQQPVTRAVISVPDHFDDSQRRAFERSARLAGLSGVRLLNDALAIGFVFREQEKNFNGPVMIYHFGGGFFRASVLGLEKAKENILACRGDSSLCGENMDLGLAEFFWREIADRHGPEMQKDLGLRQLLLDEAERAKRAVSHRGSYDIRIVRKNGFQYQRAVSRFEFVDQIRDMVESTLPLCEEALKDAGLKIPQIKKVLLAGGPTRIPLMKETVQKMFSPEVIRVMNRDETIALGMAGLANSHGQR